MSCWEFVYQGTTMLRIFYYVQNEANHSYLSSTYRGWGDGSVVKFMGHFCRGSKLESRQPHRVAHNNL